MPWRGHKKRQHGKGVPGLGCCAASHVGFLHLRKAKAGMRVQVQICSFSQQHSVSLHGWLLLVLGPCRTLSSSFAVVSLLAIMRSYYPQSNCCCRFLRGTPGATQLSQSAYGATAGCLPIGKRSWQPQRPQWRASRIVQQGQTAAQTVGSLARW